MLLRKHLNPQEPSPTRSSIFAELDVAPLSSVPSPSVSPPPSSTASPHSKTHAFFSSPFSTSPVLPPPAPPPRPKRRETANQEAKKQSPMRSLTADFFGTKSTVPKRRFLNLDLPEHGSPLAASFTSTPTPTTTEHTSYSFNRLADTSNETTPRPPELTLKISSSPSSQPPPEATGTEEDAEVIGTHDSSASSDSHGADSNPSSDEELAPGMIIRSLVAAQRPGSPMSATTPVTSPTESSPSASSSVPVTLRLTQPLGQGTFSSVWLAQDLSPTPLLLRTKRSLRDLRRKASQSQAGRLKPSRSSSSLMKRLRGGVSGTRPGGGTESTSAANLPGEGDWKGKGKYDDTGLGVGLGIGIQKRRIPSANGSIYLDERDGEASTLSISGALEALETGLSVTSNHGSSLSRASSISWQSVSSDEHGKDSKSLKGRSRTPRRTKSSKGRLVAVKLTSRGVIEVDGEEGQGRGYRASAASREERERDRTRVGFVREVEILKHISHPNITPLLSHLTTRTYHVLVLPYLPGGDLLSFVNGDGWNSLDESTLRRMFTELCKAVSWMHGVGLVHRDIKLENIVLTTPLTAGPSYPGQALPMLTDSSQFPAPSQPLIKVTDFGLSRFIDPANPLLTTRCGSEAYAAPELVIGGGRRGVASSNVLWGVSTDSPNGSPQAPRIEPRTPSASAGGYDARETDAWACGVVLYALVGRTLPFGEGPGEVLQAGVNIGGEARAFGGGGSATERRQWLMRIVKGEWVWPSHDPTGESGSVVGEREGELRGAQLTKSAGARRVVGKLLVRDPSRRARIVDLWDDEWMGAAGSSAASTHSRAGSAGSDFGDNGHWGEDEPDKRFVRVSISDDDDEARNGVMRDVGWNDFRVLGSGEGEGARVDVKPNEDDEDDDDVDDEDVNADGWIVDKEGINSIARQELQ